MRAYTAYAHPIIEYASNVWNPYLNAPPYLGLTDKLEKVQKYFTRRLFYRCQNISSLGYTERLHLLGLESLEGRRIKADLVTVYKIIRNLVDCPVIDMFRLARSIGVTRGHKYKLQVDYCRTNTCKNFFSNRIKCIWNNLPSNVVEKSSIASFRAALCNLDFGTYCKFDRNL